MTRPSVSDIDAALNTPIDEPWDDDPMESRALGPTLLEVTVVVVAEHGQFAAYTTDGDGALHRVDENQRVMLIKALDNRGAR